MTTAQVEPALAFVIDASATIALLTNDGPTGDWVTNTIAGATLHAPDLMPYEAANILRRSRLAKLLDDVTATLAHDDLVDLTIHLEPYRGLADRIWELRNNITSYDAAYVALAEHRDIPLITLDEKLSRATGPRCQIVTPS